MHLLDVHSKGARVTASVRVQRPARGVPKPTRRAAQPNVRAVWSTGPHSRTPQQRQQQQQQQPQPAYVPQPQSASGTPTSHGYGLQPASPQPAFSAVAPATKTARVRFWLKFHVDYGQSIRVIGGAEPLGAWNLSRAAPMAWSNGDLWNVTLDLTPGQVYEYKYVIVDHTGGNAVDWQRGANNVLALQAGDSEVEVYDNWRNQPGAMVVVDGSETTRERKLLSWAGELGAQRAELRQYKADLAAAREQTRMLRAEVGVMQSELSQAQAERQEAEQRAAAAEADAAALRVQLAGAKAQQRSTIEEAARLLSALDSSDPPSSSTPSSATSAPVGDGSAKQSEVPAYSASSSRGGTSNSSGTSSGGDSSRNSSGSGSSSSGSSRGFGSFFGGFAGRGGPGGPTASSSGAAVAAAAAIAAAATGSGPAGASGVGQ